VSKAAASSLYPEQEIKRRAMAWALKLAVNPKDVRFEYLTSKWGCCHRDGSIVLAYDLLDEEQSFQDYVIVHELLHLKIPNHGRVFKSLLTVHIPNWREIAAKAEGKSIVEETAFGEYC
jgi:predicted metal-dependent hydrolase